MSTAKPTFAFRLLLTILMMISVWSLAAWAIAYFVHYHAQHQLLRPANYDVTVVPAAGAAAPGEDYRLSEDGKYFVRVFTLGSAHYIDRITMELLPVVLLSVAGFVTAVYMQRRARKTAEPGAAADGGGM
jgi:hypothetical protein